MTGNQREKRAAGAGTDGSSRREGDSSRGMPGESAKGEEKVRALESKFTMDSAFCNSFFLHICRKRRRRWNGDGFGKPGGKTKRDRYENGGKYRIISQKSDKNGTLQRKAA